MNILEKLEKSDAFVVRSALTARRLKNYPRNVKISPVPARFALLCCLSIFLTGCGSNWLVGKWVLDQERTLEAITAEPPEPGEGKGILKDLVDGLQKGLSRIMLAQFEGVTLEFTSTELRRIRNGVGEARTYEIIEKPAPDSYVVKYEDGEIFTWHKVEGGIAMKLVGEAEHWIYFTPAE